MSEIDRSFRLAGPRERRAEGPARLAIAAALLLHAGVALWLVGDRHAAPGLEVPVIVATLVQEPPPPPPPAPAAKPAPPPPLSARSSGPDEKTTAPPPAQEVAPTPEAPPPAPPQAETQILPAPPSEPTEAPTPVPPQEKPKPPAPPHPTPRKDQFALREPLLAPPRDDRALGEHEMTGDPFLNTLWSRIERNREPTTPIGPSGLHLEGITVYELLLDHAGHLRALELRQSSGSAQLDTEARRMIVAATPFPPLPANYPDQTMIKITIRLFPQ